MCRSVRKDWLLCCGKPDYELLCYWLLLLRSELQFPLWQDLFCPLPKLGHPIKIRWKNTRKSTSLQYLWQIFWLFWDYYHVVYLKQKSLLETKVLLYLNPSVTNHLRHSLLVASGAFHFEQILTDYKRSLCSKIASLFGHVKQVRCVGLKSGESKKNLHISELQMLCSPDIFVAAFSTLLSACGPL